MNPRINYTFVGAFVLVLLISGIGFSAWLSQDRRNAERIPYVTYFFESVSGLNERAAVKYRGVPVGFVERISLVNDPYERVRLDLRLDPQVEVRTDTYATLQFQGITGLLFVELKSQGLRGERLQTSESNPAEIPSQASRLLEFTEGISQAVTEFTELVSILKRVSQQLERLTDDPVRDQLLSTLVAFEQLAQTADSRLQGINPQSWEQLAHTLTELGEEATQLARLLPQGLNSLEEELRTQLENLSTQLITLTQDTGSTTRQLTPLIHQAESLIEQLRLESHSWIRGNQQPSGGPGE